ncbi:TPA: response regulator [Enterococcus faecium]|nr:response regulator [Enterococcus faecium]
MYKLMIVDDEPIVLKGLSRFAWQEHGFQLVTAVKNGLYAVEYLSDNPVDVILSDIKMPKMNGIKLLQQVNQLTPDVEVVFLTGHADFSYAKEAIKYGAFDYLLKPVDFSELADVMNRVKEKIAKRNDEKDQWLNLIQREKQVSANLKYKRILPGFFSGSDQLAEVFQNFQVDVDYRIVMVGFRFVNPRKTAGYSDIHFILEQQTQRVFPDQAIQMIQKERQDNGYALFVLPKNVPKKSQLREMTRICEKATITIKEKLGVSVKFAVSEIVSDVRVVDELKKQVDTLLNAGRYSVSHQVMTYEGYLGKEYGLWIYTEQFKYDLFRTLMANDRQMLRQLTDAWVQMLPENGDLVTVKFSFNGFLMDYLQYHHERRSDDGKSGLENRIYNRIVDIIERNQRAEDLSTFQEILREGLIQLGYISEETSDRPRSKKAILVDAIIDQIKQEYFKDLSLDDFSNRYGFSKPYLSKVIKEETGRSFMDILSGQRLTMAAELLKNEDLRVKEISDMVGYADDSYFIKVFKKEFGMTPSDYRRISH